MSKFAYKSLFVAVVCLGVSGCSPTFTDHGYIPIQDELDEVVVGVDTRGSIEGLLGVPSSSGVMVEGDWYYIRTRIRSYAFYEPKIVEREMVAVSFDSSDVVENVERFGLENGKVVTISRRVTDQPIKGPSFLGQILGNIGNLNAGDLLGG